MLIAVASFIAIGTLAASAEETRVVNEAVVQKLCPNPKMRCNVLGSFEEIMQRGSLILVAALSDPDPTKHDHAEAFREIGDRCFKKWAPDFEMAEYCFKNQSNAYLQLQK
jgi:hypothetical protein